MHAWHLSVVSVDVCASLNLISLQVGGCCSLALLELLDRRIGRYHLFKRSVILVKVRRCFFVAAEVSTDRLEVVFLCLMGALCQGSLRFRGSCGYTTAHLTGHANLVLRTGQC